MKFFRRTRMLSEDEGGAVTVDWVVLTASVVGLGIATLSVIRSGVGILATKINAHMSAQAIVSTF